MTINEAFNKRVDALLQYQYVSDHASFPYKRKDIMDIIECQNNVLKVYYETQEVVPFEDSDNAMIDSINKSLLMLNESLNHPAFR